MPTVLQSKVAGFRKGFILAERKDEKNKTYYQPVYLYLSCKSYLIRGIQYEYQS